MVLSVIGNKTDLSEQRKVSREEAFQYAQSIGGNYFESSALQDEGMRVKFMSMNFFSTKLQEMFSELLEIPKALYININKTK